MSQTVSYRPEDNQLETSQPSNDLFSGIAKEMDDEAICAETAHNRQLIDWFVVQCLAVSIEKIKDLARSLATDELIGLIHQENFKLFVFRTIVENIADCKIVNQEVIEG